MLVGLIGHNGLMHRLGAFICNRKTVAEAHFAQLFSFAIF
jgi:hypothetical protein